MGSLPRVLMGKRQRSQSPLASHSLLINPVHHPEWHTLGQQTCCFTTSAHPLLLQKSVRTVWRSTNTRTAPSKLQLAGWLQSAFSRKQRDVPGAVAFHPKQHFPLLFSCLPPKSVPPPCHKRAWHMQGLRNATDPRQPAGGSVLSQIPGQPRRAGLHAPPVGVGRRLFSLGHLGSMHRALMDASPIVRLRAWIGWRAVGNTSDPETHVAAKMLRGINRGSRSLPEHSRVLSAQAGEHREWLPVTLS